VPKLWTDTVEEHRRAVRDAVLAGTAKLVAEPGLTSVTMSGIAAETGIGRATLYKYFPDVEAILIAWHERQVASHLQHLAAVRDQAGSDDRLEAVLTAYALMTHEQPHGSEIAALLHRGEHIGRAHQHLTGLVEDLVADAARGGRVRGDVAPAELASYCLHALAAAASLPSGAAVHRLVAVTLAGLDPPPGALMGARPITHPEQAGRTGR
jgi:AcrR family transcriptional regulator